MCLAYHENYFDHESCFDKVNAISDPPIPAATGKLEKLQTVDHSNHTFCGQAPSPLGYLKNLNTHSSLQSWQIQVALAFSWLSQNLLVYERK
ncbi:hypothetical protein BDE02_01G210600 [Populus trichocarpa]|uniref:Uncharacterized protein n=1 Tax=Populus trichocarpa TaxID=3694 RepID=A0A3N7FD25_POPTR|nr:hypothetical protein BDE02_01G210600 [Populus trichocarpa]